MVFAGIGWCLMVLAGTWWCQLVLTIMPSAPSSASTHLLQIIGRTLNHMHRGMYGKVWYSTSVGNAVR